MKKLILIAFVLLFISCEFLGVEAKKDDRSEPIVASVDDVNLYLSDVEYVVPPGIAKEDSLVLIKSYINSWAKKQILLKKAKENVSEVNNKEINSLVKNYRESLFINGYKERLIKQQLDTIVPESEIVAYYDKNKENFKLNEELLQIQYIHFGSDFLDKREVIRKFRYGKEEDLEDLENQTINFKDYLLRDKVWMSLDEVLLKIPPFRDVPKRNLLKISKFIQKENSLGVYLVAVKKVLRRNDVAPMSYIKSNIKQIILHKRKLELIREIEKTFINDAIKNNNFKEY